MVLPRRSESNAVRRDATSRGEMADCDCSVGERGKELTGGERSEFCREAVDYEAIVDCVR